MAMFARFPPPPGVGEVTVAERNCTLLSEAVDSGDVSRTTPFQTSGKVKRFCDHWVKDAGKTVKGGGASAFLGQDGRENHWKLAWNSWRKEGVWAAVRSLQESAEKDGVSSCPVKVASSLVAWADYMELLATNIWTSHSQLSLEEAIVKYSSHSNWLGSKVRAIALHPRMDFMAIATLSDELEIRSIFQNDERKTVLKDRQQKGVACVEWAPHCDSVLAVGVMTGILIWYVDPCSPATRFVASWVRPETSPGHSPVTSLSWGPWGNLLVSACPLESCLVVWDVPIGLTTPIHRTRDSGVALVAWSPDGCRVFAGGVSSAFRVWETKSWTNECWADFSGRCKCACWGPEGKLLLFALEADPSLYYISFHNETGSSTAIKCANLSPAQVQEREGGQAGPIVGGCVQDMVWDVTGHRLAVIFTPESEGSEMVALFRTDISHFLLDLLPVGFVQGLPGERPEIVQFKRNVESGALLAVVWSSGRISFLPMQFLDGVTASSAPNFVPSSQTQKPHPLKTMPMNASLVRTPLNGRSSMMGSGDPLSSIKLYSTHK